MESQPDVPKLLTLIVTTSPTPSSPSTELLDTIFESFRLYCPDLLHCRIIVVIDGYDQISSNPRLKKGVVTPEQAENFSLYKKAVKDLCISQRYGCDASIVFEKSQAMAEYGSPGDAQNAVSYTISQTTDSQRLTFIEPERRIGFGLAVRSALRLTETPYVWIQQHDWALAANIPISPLLHVMAASETNVEAPIKYVCFPAVRMLSYAISSDTSKFPVLKDLTSSLKGDFSPPAEPDVKIPLTPLFFWHDKPHVASVEHYLNRVFPSRLAMLRGDFIEDKIGQRARAQMKDGLWSKWATWLYYPEQGKQLCLRHLQGRTWEGTQKEVEKAMMWRQLHEKGEMPCRAKNLIARESSEPTNPLKDDEV